MQVLSGSLLVYRVFDVAEEIDLKRVPQADTRVRISPSKPRAVIVKDDPLRVQLGSVELSVCGQSRTFEVSATIWHYGAISICFETSLAAMAWDSLLSVGCALSNEGDLVTRIDAEASKRCAELSKLLGASLIKPVLSSFFEDYVVYSLREVEGVETGEEMLKKVDLPALLLGEDKERLAQRSVDEILQGAFQYGVNDLAVIDWNSAVVFEADGGRDIIDVLEFVLTQLLEFRYYDELIDQRLKEVYDAVQAGREKLLRSPFSRIAREANTRYLEFSEFMERIDNSLKVVGDFYLAVIYRGAVKRFRIPDWQGSITRKMNALARVSELLQGELNVRRSHWLEIIVILLIAFEIVSAFFKVTAS